LGLARNTEKGQDIYGAWQFLPWKIALNTKKGDSFSNSLLTSKKAFPSNGDGRLVFCSFWTSGIVAPFEGIDLLAQWKHDHDKSIPPYELRLGAPACTGGFDAC
jgi:hypothetical protein